MHLLHWNAALLVPAIIIKLAMAHEDKRDGLERE
jgi:hypothetical protein